MFIKGKYLVVLIPFFMANMERANAETTFNFIAAPEFGRGLGVGFEFGGENRLTLGAGAGFQIGYSNLEGFVSSLNPGVAAGYRRYLGNWYFGPSLGINYHQPLSPPDRTGGSSASALLDAGHRWQWRNRSTWNTKVGLGAGAAWWPDHGLYPAIGLTVSIGFGL